MGWEEEQRGWGDIVLEKLCIVRVINNKWQQCQMARRGRVNSSVAGELNSVPATVLGLSLAWWVVVTA